jgi:hypothetical protein
MQRVTQNSQTTKTHNRNPFLPRLGKIDDYSAKSKPILSILESTEMKKSIGTHSFDSRIGKIETQFYRIKEREDFQREDPFYREGEKRERRRSFSCLISKRGGVYLVF